MAMNGTVWGIRLPWRTDLDKARGRNEEIKYEKRWFVLFKRAKLAQTGGRARFNTLLNIFQCKTRKLWQKNSLWLFSCNYHWWFAHQKTWNCAQNFDERKYVQWSVCSSTLSAFMPCWKDVMGRRLIWRLQVLKMILMVNFKQLEQVVGLGLGQIFAHHELSPFIQRNMLLLLIQNFLFLLTINESSPN